ncbi:pilus assembly FimT family protein [Desulfovibrio inopinatus]|uniref:pilus assembly FimT family protein n=1 Tax=Desulfovibrio inopinatus TaxID=102109 RepID=UPI00048231DF|nr:prepilin-type N-terminal cleavage/methylation domain-containing protein [Desulfovibrio inopinatus]
MPISAVPTSTKPHGGFTLAELIIVMVIIGLGVALAVPRLSPLLFREHANSALRVLTGALAQARSRALLTGTPKAVVVQLDTGRFRLDEHIEPTTSDDAARQDWSRAHKEVEDDTPPWRDLPGSLRLRVVFGPTTPPVEEGEIWLRVDADGMFEPATLIFSDDDGNVLPTRLNPGTGRLDPLDDPDEVEEELTRYELLHSLPQYTARPWAEPKDPAPDYERYIP